MKKTVTLFKNKSEGLIVEELIHYRDGMLVFDGWHAGDKVERHWGDWDYEFWINVPAASIPKLKSKLWVSWMPMGLFLHFLAWKFPADTLFREVEDFLKKHDIEHESWAWV